LCPLLLNLWYCNAAALGLGWIAVEGLPSKFGCRFFLYPEADDKRDHDRLPYSLEIFPNSPHALWKASPSSYPSSLSEPFPLRFPHPTLFDELQ
jgi:hypothetical protein